jgi:hypothetical protein
MEYLLKNENNKVNVESAPSLVLNLTHFFHLDARLRGDRSVSRTLAKEFISD